MTFDLDRLVRPNVRTLKPYSSARSEFVGSADIFLDANENSFGSPAGGGLNRYPDPLQRRLKELTASTAGVPAERIFVGNGSDEAIDLLFRIFCVPGADEVIICPPTYGMYRVSADVNDVRVCEVPLTSEFQLDVAGILAAANERTKLIFVCSPNNPTGNLMRREDVLGIARSFDGIVVVDEAYIHFAAAGSMIGDLETQPNLVILQTFSKAWGMAGIRVGLAFASPEIVGLMNRVKPPYNVSEIAQHAAIDAFKEKEQVDEWIAQTLAERAKLARSFQRLAFVQKVYPTDANFLLVRVDDPERLYRFLIGEGIVVRNRSNVLLCEGTLRITVGTEEENDMLLASLLRFEEQTREL